MVRAVARIDLGALRANCERLRAELGESRLCGVGKGDGCGHGATACAQAALDGGASALAVAAATEAAELARAGLVGPGGRLPADDDGPELITLGALTDAEVDVVLGAGSAVSVWRE